MRCTILASVLNNHDTATMADYGMITGLMSWQGSVVTFLCAPVHCPT
jgi:Flp pilus assembly pilin Flp